MADSVFGANSTTGNESAKRKHQASSCDPSAAEFHSRAHSIQSRLESLEQSLSRRKRRPEEDYRFEKLVTHSVRDVCGGHESANGNVGRPLPTALTSDSSRHEMNSVLGKRLEAPQFVSLLSRQKRPLLNYDLPRLNPCIRNMQNGAGPSGVHHQPSHNTPSDGNKGR